MLDFHSVFSFGANTAPSKKQKNITEKLESFSKDEDGIATVWAIFWMIICFALSGLAIDVTNAWKVHAILQYTADSTALAGAYELQTAGNDSIEGLVEIQANEFATLNMHEDRYGDVLIDADIQVGYWDPVNYSFSEMVGTADPRGLADAVRTTTRQNSVQNTGVGTFFLRFVGFQEFTVAASATATVFEARCYFDGLIAAGHVKLSTKESFYDEYCIHGEEGLDISHDNFFEGKTYNPDGTVALEGTIASTEFEENCGPSAIHCTIDQNPGIVPAFREQSLNLSKVTNIGLYIDILTTEYSNDPDLYMVNAYVGSLVDPLYNYEPDETAPDQGSLPILDRVTFSPKPNEPLDVSLLDENKINVIDCGRNGFDVNLAVELEVVEGEEAPDPLILENIVIVGEGCDFKFDSSVNFKNAIIATTATGTQTFSGSSGVVLGEDDGCVQGNEVTLITAGSVNFAAKLAAYDLEIIAADDVHLAAKANDMGEHYGTSVTAGGDIQVTTGHTFHGCLGRTISVFDSIKSWKLVL